MLEPMLLTSRSPLGIFIGKTPQEDINLERAKIQLEARLRQITDEGKKAMSLADIYGEARVVAERIKAEEPTRAVGLGSDLLTGGRTEIPPLEFEPVTQADIIRAERLAESQRLSRGPALITENDFAADPVIDENGFEIGLRRKDGSVFNIGFLAKNAEGDVFEYQGNGEWIKVIKINNRWVPAQ